MTLPMSKAQFDRQFAMASRRGAAWRSQPLATAVRYDEDRGVIIDLNNDCSVRVPLRLLPELLGASTKDLRQVEIMGMGQAITWPTLDQQFEVLQILAEAVGARTSRGSTVRAKTRKAGPNRKRA